MDTGSYHDLTDQISSPDRKDGLLSCLFQRFGAFDREASGGSGREAGRRLPEAGCGCGGWSSVGGRGVGRLRFPRRQGFRSLFGRQGF